MKIKTISYRSVESSPSIVFASVSLCSLGLFVTVPSFLSELVRTTTLVPPADLSVHASLGTASITHRVFPDALALYPVPVFIFTIVIPMLVGVIGQSNRELRAVGK